MNNHQRPSSLDNFWITQTFFWDCLRGRRGESTVVLNLFEASMFLLCIGADMSGKGSTLRGCKPSLGVKRLSSKQRACTGRVEPDMQVKHGRVLWSEEISLKAESTQSVAGNRFTPGLTTSFSSSDGPSSGTFQNFRLQSRVLFVWGARAWWRW